MKPSKHLVIILLAICLSSMNAAVHIVGTHETYSTPNALYQANQTHDFIQDSDTIYIKSGVYIGLEVLAVWRKNNLFISGLDGVASLFADGQYIIGKGIFVSAGDNITYENLAFFDASVPDQNGAGIRLDGNGLTVRKCFFSNNENGILANNSETGDIHIEYSEFSKGGFGDGFSHNIYINHTRSLLVQYCYFHDAVVGHQIKSRADQNIIRYNRIADNEENSSRLIDIPNGGLCNIIGNELIQGERAENKNLIAYGLEGLNNPGPHNLNIVHNTFINYRANSCIFFNAAIDTDVFLVANNIFGGICNLFIEKEPEMVSNIISEDTEAFKFLDEENLSLEPGDDSNVIDAGNNDLPEELKALFEYVHPTAGKIREIIQLPDVGAHEGDVTISIKNLARLNISISNPVKDEIRISGSMMLAYIIIDMQGRTVQHGKIENGLINITDLTPGMYIFKGQNIEPIKLIKI